jgi:hypothetical protein
MARHFLSASSQYLQNASFAAVVTPCTFAIWGYGATLGVLDMAVSDNLTTAFNYFRLRINITTKAVSASFGQGSGASQSQGTPANLVQNAWNHGAAVFTDSTHIAAYINGVGTSGVVSTITTSAISYANIGLWPYNNVNNFSNLATGAEAAIWNVALTANEIAALAKGIRPNRVRRASLVAYWPLWGLLSPEPDFSGNKYSLTVNNAPTQANHSPTEMFTPNVWATKEYDIISVNMSPLSLATAQGATVPNPTVSSGVLAANFHPVHN